MSQAYFPKKLWFASLGDWDGLSKTLHNKALPLFGHDASFVASSPYVSKSIDDTGPLIKILLNTNVLMKAMQRGALKGNQSNLLNCALTAIFSSYITIRA